MKNESVKRLKKILAPNWIKIILTMLLFLMSGFLFKPLSLLLFPIEPCIHSIFKEGLIVIVKPSFIIGHPFKLASHTLLTFGASFPN